MKKTAVLLYPQFSEYELSVSLSVLMQGNKPIVTIGLSDQPIKGESGLSCLADTTIEKVDPEEFDSLLLPGCMDIKTLDENQELLELIKQIHANDSVIAAISSAPFLLAKAAGVLKGKKYTVGLPIEAIKTLGAFEIDNYSEDLVVEDENIITARGRGFIQFGITLGKALNLKFSEKWYQG